MAVTYTDNGGNRDGSNLEFTYSFPTIEETNTTEVPEIHYRDFQIESGDTE